MTLEALPRRPRLVMLDRDGVLNVLIEALYVCSIEQLIVIDGAAAAVQRLATMADVCVVTNQSAVGRGMITRPRLDAIHAELARRLGMLSLRFFVCPHAPAESCACRKPRPHLLLEAMRLYRARPHECVFAGDSATDYLAARACGVAFVLLQTGNGVRDGAAVPADVPRLASVAALADAVAPRPRTVVA